MPDRRTQHKEILLNGKFFTADPVAIGQNFQTLTNLRYTDTHIKGVGGMAKINVTAMTTCLQTRSAFHFMKSQPPESHVIAQVRTTAGTTSELKENTAVIPGTAAFTATALWSDSTGFGLGRFSEAPDGQMIYCNGVDACIWGGNEMKLGAFLTSTAAVTTGGATDPKDYTDIINNTKSDGDNVAIIGGGIDTYTKLMMHMDGVDGGTTFTDSVGTHTPVGGGGDENTDTSQAKFGAASLQLDGTGDYVTIPDHADFNYGSNPFTIDLWIRFNSLPGITDYMGIYYQEKTGDETNNRQQIYLYGVTASTYYIIFKERQGGAQIIYLGEVEVSLTTNKWYHLAIIRGWGGVANDFAITLDGIAISTTTNAIVCADLDGAVNIGYYNAGGASNFNGWIDEFRVSKGIARWTADFTPSARPYSASARTWLIGSPRPLQGLKYTVSLANTVASTMTGSYWNGTTWNALTLTDNTDTGASLAATGTVTFSSTVGLAKPKYLESYFLYWYQFAIDAGGAEISHITSDAPFQGIVDMWDGVFRDVVRFYKYTTAYLDNTINVLYDDYDSTAAETYSNLSSMAAFVDPANCLEIGFFEKMTGLKIDIAPEYTNSTAATTMSVDYWDGTDYVSVGAITDGTSEGAISFAKSGVVTWNNNSLSNETLKVVSNSPPLYYYRVKFDDAMDASVRVNYVGGISAQKEISYYKFPIFAQGRVLLCGDMSAEKNKALVSGKYMPQVYNGLDSVNLYFGEEGELTCGTELFSQFGSSLYSLILMFKNSETWIVAGQDINEWENNTFLLSSTIGCPAPLTLKTINLSAEPGAGINRALAIWQGANGVYMSDGRAPIPIHGDIKEYFDPLDARCIPASAVGSSVGFMDPVKQEYHLLINSGATELVYDIARNKWFVIDRTADLQCGVTVHDTYGNAYTYGFLDTGYMERLEYGNDFDGTDIIHTFQTGDMAFAGLAVETRLSAIRLIAVKKALDAAVTFTHYSDGATAGTEVSMNIINAGHRIAQAKFTEKLDGDPFHSLKFALTTDDAVPGFEPLAVVATFHPTHEDT